METPFGFLWRILVALHPSGSADPDIQLTWRQVISAVVSVMVVIGGASLGWAQGWIPGAPGVATKADVQQVSTTLDTRIKSIESTMNSINLRDVKNNIQAELVNSCTAQIRGNQDSLARANDNLYGRDGAEGLLDQYRDLTGHDYSVPPCNEILITPAPH
jgi:hypothetical protein